MDGCQTTWNQPQGRRKIVLGSEKNAVFQLSLPDWSVLRRDMGKCYLWQRAGFQLTIVFEKKKCFLGFNIMCLHETWILVIRTSSSRFLLTSLCLYVSHSSTSEDSNILGGVNGELAILKILSQGQSIRAHFTLLPNCHFVLRILHVPIWSPKILGLVNLNVYMSLFKTHILSGQIFMVYCFF